MLTLAGGFEAAKVVEAKRGEKFFEWSIHLGDVLATESDRKIAHTSNSSTIDYYEGDVVSAQDYYPFGMIMPGRTVINGSGYRFGFSGQEKDDEIKGSGNSVEFKFRIYDSRLGRFLTTDPLSMNFPWNSAYAYAENKVIQGVDIEGKEFLDYRYFINYSEAKQKNPDSWDITNMARARIKTLGQQLWDISEFTDFNDAVVIGTTITRGSNAIDIKGNRTSSWDRAFAYGGALLPVVSGSALAKMAKAFGIASEAIRGSVKYTGFGGDVLVRGDKTTTVLGKFKGGIENLKRSGAFDVEGLNFLNLPKGTWSWEKNRQFIDNAIKNNDVIRVVSDPRKSENLFEMIDGKITDELSTYGKEVQYLENAGYRFNSSSNTFEKGLKNKDRITTK